MTKADLCFPIILGVPHLISLPLAKSLFFKKKKKLQSL